MMREGSILIDGITYVPVQAEYGRCCVICDLGQIRCNFDCNQFEENNNEYVSLRALKS